MFPKIQHKNLQNKQTLYPKNSISIKSERQNNISQLKKLREFLQSKQVQQSEPVLVDRQNKNISVMSTINHLSNTNISQTAHIKLQKYDRFKNNTSDISKRRKVNLNKQNNRTLKASLNFQQKYNHLQKQRLRLKEILNYCKNRQSQQINNNLLAKYKLL